MNKILVDTNILIYSIDEDSKYFKFSQDILLNKDFDLYTTSKNLTEFLAVITRLPNASLSLDQAIELTHDFSSIMTVLYPTINSYQIFLDLLKKYNPTGLKIHDFEIMSTGIAHGVYTIATINKKDFEQVTEINIYNK